MSKHFLFWALIALFVGSAGAVFFRRYLQWKETHLTYVMTEKDRAEAATKLLGKTVVSSVTPVKLPLSRPVRLAIGGLGFRDDEQNGRLADLMLTQLRPVEGFELIDRQSLGMILQETHLSLSGLVRARDAVRVGRLLRADWFLLGTIAKINGTNSMVVRMVDTRTGIVQDAAVFPEAQDVAKLAGRLAGFARECRQAAAESKPRVYLAIGVLEDMSVNNRQANFPAQLRGYLAAAYRGANVSLLEREDVDILLQEMRLDLAGLTETVDGNSPAPMQSAFWLVDGQYQSFETTKLEVEVTLRLQRIFGAFTRATLRGPPDEVICGQVKQAIDSAMNRQSGYIVPSLVSEIRAQMMIGKEMLGNSGPIPWVGLVYVDQHGNDTPDQAARRKRNVEEAARAFKTVLLLDATNREAMVCLAACLRSPGISQIDEARDYYRQIIDEQKDDQWNNIAQKGLIETFQNWSGRVADPVAKARWFEIAEKTVTNSPAAEFYRRQAEHAAEDSTIPGGEVSKAEEAAQKRLFEALRSCNDVLHGKTGSFSDDLGMADYVKIYGTNLATAARDVAELLPKMTAQVPELQDWLPATVVSFQVDTNAPVVADFQKQLDELSQNPKPAYATGPFWNHLEVEIYPWAIAHKKYTMAVQLLETKLRAFPGGTIGPKSETNEDKIALAYADMDMEHWQDALEIFEGFTNQPVIMTTRGQWGPGWTTVLTGKLANLCREKLGRNSVHDPREFDMGRDCFCMCSPSAFAVDENGVWIAINGQLLHLDSDLKTNLAELLSVPADSSISCMTFDESRVWIGTDGVGLIEYEKATRQFHHLTEKDGLMMDKIGSLRIVRDVLWIGYGSNSRFSTYSEGGLGKLDLQNRSILSFTPTLLQKQAPGREDAVRGPTKTPPRFPVIAIAEGAGGDIWFVTKNAGTRLNHYRAADDTWEVAEQTCTSVVGDASRLFTGHLSNYFGGQKTGPLGVNILDFKGGKWQSLKEEDGLVPGAVTALALDGADLWVGGLGYIALVDIEQNKVRKFARIPSNEVNQIQTGAGYLWAEYDGYLHRTVLQNLR